MKHNLGFPVRTTQTNKLDQAVVSALTKALLSGINNHYDDALKESRNSVFEVLNSLAAASAVVLCATSAVCYDLLHHRA